MGLLINGVWHDKGYDTESTDGAFEREAVKFRGDINESDVESGRYHLYVSLACPWAHRTLIFRKLKNLEDHIDLSIVSADMLENGWSFDKNTGSTGDKLYGKQYLHEIYTKAKSDYTGRVTVPVLWDKKTQTIINNESADIIRIFNKRFNQLTDNHLDFYPKALQEKIDAMNEKVYKHINNGVYRCGFATTQSAYEDAFQSLFALLDELDELLAVQEFLVDNKITEADWRLFTTLIRFDPVYHGHFKCNYKRIVDYPALSRYLSKLYHWPGVADTVNFDHIKRHYYFSHKDINPTQIVPLGPDLDYLKK